MGQDELEVPDLATLAQIVGACTNGDGVHVLAAPALDYPGGSIALWLIASLEKQFGDPGAAELVFLAKFVARTRPDNRHPGVVGRKVAGRRGVVAETGNVHGLRFCPAADHSRTRGREQQHRTVNISPSSQ